MGVCTTRVPLQMDASIEIGSIAMREGAYQFVRQKRTFLATGRQLQVSASGAGREGDDECGVDDGLEHSLYGSTVKLLFERHQRDTSPFESTVWEREMPEQG